MPVRPLILPSLCAAMALLSGCGSSSGRYPDRSPETQARADGIREEGRVAIERIDRDLADEQDALRFRSNQVKEQARLDREQVQITCDRAIEPLTAKRKVATDEMERDMERDRLEAEAQEKDGTIDQKERIKLDAARQTRAVDHRKANAGLDREIAGHQAKAREEIAAIETREQKAIAKIDSELANTETKARERRLAVESDTASRLNEVEPPKRTDR